MFVGINSIDYQLNLPTSSNTFLLYFSLGKSLPDNTKLLVSCYFDTGAIKALKLSILIISPDFFYKDIYSTDYLYYSDSYTLQTITLTNNTYALTTFITYCYIETVNTGNGIMGIFLSTVSSSYPFLDMEIIFSGNLNYGSVDYRVIVWYPILAKKYYNIDVEVYNYLYLPPSYTFELGFNKYKVGNSLFFMALKAFNYDAVSSSTDDGFKYSHTFGSDSTY